MRIISSGKALYSAEYYRRKKKERRTRLIIAVYVILALFSLLLFGFNNERFIISHISLVGMTNPEDEKRVSQSLQSLISGRYFWLVPKASIFFYPRRMLTLHLLENFPIIKQLDFDLVGFQDLVVQVEEREPFALYCRSLSGQSDCYFLDEEGFIFASAATLTEENKFIFTREDLSSNPVGQHFLETEEFKKVTAFVSSLEPVGIHPTGLKIDEEESELFIENGGVLVWRRDSDLDLLRSDLEAFLSNKSIRSQADFIHRIRRLDMRIKDQIYWILD